MSDYGINSPKDPKIIEVAETLNTSYKTWVDHLSIDDKDFKVETKKWNQPIEMDSHRNTFFFLASNLINF